MGDFIEPIPEDWSAALNIITITDYSSLVPTIVLSESGNGGDRSNMYVDMLCCLDKLYLSILIGGCGWYNDSILCWPPTPSDTLARLPCSAIPELASPCHPGHAHLYCHAPGRWDAATNYTECLQADMEPVFGHGVRNG